MHPIFTGLLFLGVVLFVSYLIDQEQKRKKAIRDWAKGRKWSFSSERRKGWERDFSGIKLFQKGHSRWGQCVVNGILHDCPVTLLDYQYTTGHGKNRSTHKAGVAILHCGFPTIPLQIRRENPLDKVGEFLGADDIDFESAEFSRKFFVKSADRKWAYDILHTRAMDYLLSAPAVTIEFGFGEIAVYRNGWCNPDKYETALDVAGNLRQLIPDFVIQQMKGRPS